MSFWTIIDKPLSLLEISLEAKLKEYWIKLDSEEFEREWNKLRVPKTDPDYDKKKEFFLIGYRRAKELYHPNGS